MKRWEWQEGFWEVVGLLIVALLALDGIARVIAWIAVRIIQGRN